MYNAAISACEKSADWQAALALLCRTESARVQTNVITFNASISACEKASQWQLALSLMSVLVIRRMQADVVSYSSSISACQKGSEWQLACVLLAAAGTAHVPRQEMTHNAAVSACDRSWTRALMLVSFFPVCRLRPNVITVTATIATLETSNWSDALYLNRHCWTLQMSPNSFTYTSSSSICEKAGRWQEALELLHCGEQLQHVIAFNSVIGACQKACQSEQSSRSAGSEASGDEKPWLRT
eukprot:g22994.t1